MGNSITENLFNPQELPQDYLATKIKSVLNKPITDIQVSPLAGDASTRQYFRVNYRLEGNVPGSMVFMQLKQTLQDGKVTDFEQLTRFLQNCNLPVPEVYLSENKTGRLFLEDCGDILFWEKVGPEVPFDQKKTWYRKAVILLANMQHRGTKKMESGCPAYSLRFDVEKLMWEFSFMLDHYIQGIKGIKLNETDRKNLCDAFIPICETLAAQTPVFTHRDYHSRNIMVKDDSLILLDYQDARMGPSQYDLASLLRDSYVAMEEELVQEMISLFIELKEKADQKKVGQEEFRNIFDKMAVQRNLKAIGTFAYQKMVRGTDRYLEDIPRTLNHVKSSMDQNPDLIRFRNALGAYITEIL